jgi:hypothetical protein
MDTPVNPQGTSMAEEEEPILTHPGTPEVATHVRDYERFTQLLKWGAVVSLVTALFVLLIIS